MPSTSLCLLPEPNECTCFNQSMHRERSVASYASGQHTCRPSSDSQNCQTGELAEGVNAAREIVVLQVPECGLCATWANLDARKQRPSHIPLFADRTKYKCTRFKQLMHRERSLACYAYDQYTRKPYSDSQPCQLSELAEGLDTSRKLILTRVPECGFCAT